MKYEKIVLYVIGILFIVTDPSNKLLIYSSYFLLGSLLFTLDRNIKIPYYSILFILIWFYGVFIGYNNEYVFRNNIGITFFVFLIYFKNTKLSNDFIFKLIYNLTIISISVYLWEIKEMNILELIINKTRVNYSISGTFGFILYPYVLARTFNVIPNKFNTYKFLDVFLFIILNLIAFLFVSSKGIYLFIIVTFILLFKKNIKHIFFVMPILYLFYNIDFFEGFTVFGVNDESNLSRMNQFNAIINELSFFGNGWGAEFNSNILKSRDYLGYSTELSYLNLIHKIGVFSILIFLYYINLIVKILKLKNTNPNKHLSFGSLFYLFTSLGNPSLFAIQYIYLNLIGETILKNNE